MAIRERRAAGLEYLALATELLQRARLADPEAGVWEAADLQWWWRTPRSSDTVEQRVWLDADGPVAAVGLTEWTRAWGCDPLLVPGRVPLTTVWAGGLEAIDALRLDDVETLVREDDPALRSLLAASGFAPDGELSGITWMDADERAAVAPLPEQFAIVDRTRRRTRPHPMRRRSGDQIETRLRQCSLYEPELDLAVETVDGEVAGYSLYWFDPVTMVGLVEPMRVEDAYQRRGLARAMLTEGLDRLARRGARRLKVGYGTDAALALYTGVGFRPAATCVSYRGRVRRLTAS
ncbi:MAG: GNAT family N-acetyltransferase [Thermoleophilia bacterium]|nr:GNAT family N-acetyltransferase [Thermoleophilia bacterium]